MNRAHLLASATAALAVIALVAGCAGGEEPTDAAATQPAPTASATPPEATPEPADQEAPATSQAAAQGEYVDYAQYQSDAAGYAAAGDVVLFFNASWCPTCKAADANFSDAAFPTGLTVVSVDYDDNTALRQQYGVTVQHTFVQIDADGNEVAKWTGSSSVEQVAEQVV